MTTTSISTSKQIDFTAIERATNLQDSTKYKYTREIEKFLETGSSLGDYDAVQVYAITLSTSSRSFFKAALRLVTADYERRVKSSVTPKNIGQAQAAIMRLEALRGAVTVSKPKGTKVHIWLSQAQVRDITALCGDNLEGKRDWIILGLLLGAGLRRSELATLTFDALKQQPTKNGKMRDVLEVQGKGAKNRVVPIKPILADRLREWKEITGSGRVARSLGRKKELGESMSAVAIFHLVNKYGKKIGFPKLAPHDLRRTFAQLGYDAGVPITQLSVLLGHSSIDVTQKYLNLDLDLETTASDFIPLSGD
ncbi:MAG: site-specific integrase [Anaerolineae bacterium]|jgi:integrase|nr:site-specific integrase [Anaerolineae bacterium]MBT7773875.1 site-specific integrase [Anaerolineae bacterium]